MVSGCVPAWPNVEQEAVQAQVLGGRPFVEVVLKDGRDGGLSRLAYDSVAMVGESGDARVPFPLITQQNLGVPIASLGKGRVLGVALVGWRWQ